MKTQVLGGAAFFREAGGAVPSLPFLAPRLPTFLGLQPQHSDLTAFTAADPQTPPYKDACDHSGLTQITQTISPPPDEQLNHTCKVPAAL